MKKRGGWQIVVFLVVYLISSTVCAAQETITFQVNESGPYWTEKSKDGGFGTEIVQAISKEMGLQTHIEFVPLKRLILNRTNNDIGNPLFYMNNQDFGAIIPIAVNYSSFFVYDQELKRKTTELDLKGKRIGSLQGSIANIDAENYLGQFEESYSEESLIKKLKTGRLDAVIALNLVGRAMIKKLYPNEIDKFHTYMIHESASPIALMIDSDYPNAAIIGKRYQEGLHRIMKKGVYQKILKKYYGEIPLPSYWYKDLSKFERLYTVDFAGES